MKVKQSDPAIKIKSRIEDCGSGQCFGDGMEYTVVMQDLGNPDDNINASQISYMHEEDGARFQWRNG